MRGRLQEVKGDNYERPNQSWFCTLAGEGGPCPTGPTKSGACPRAAACHPLQDGDRWSCNRADSRGGPCDHGPTPEGECPNVHSCTPLSSLRKRRGSFVLGCLLFTIGALTVALSAEWRNEFLAPGDLSVHHAQLVTRSEATNRCASCHAAGNQTVADWLQHFNNPELAQPTQYELCLECHREQIESSVALWAHNIDPNAFVASHARDTIPPEHRNLNPTEPITCSACHREHHGAEHDLRWMSNTACQACHSEQYESFAADHPEFDAWPMARRTRIIFDHGTHQSKHFSKKNQSFECSKCHAIDSSGQFQQTLSYETTCAECHDEDMANSWAAGMAIFSLPMLDKGALSDAKQEVGQWPEAANGDFDGALSAPAKLLLAADPKAAESLAILGSDFDFFDVDPGDAKHIAAAADIVWAAKGLYFDVATQGQEAIQERLTKVLGRGIDTQELARLSAHLSPENVSALTQNWLSELPEEIAARRSGNSQPTSSTTAGETPQQDRDLARQKVSAGGWFRDDLTLSIRFQPTGHADPFVTAWLELLAEASGSTHAAIALPLLRQQMLPTAPGQCGSCHSVDRLETGKWIINWQPKQPNDRGRGFTFFNHGPHLTQAELADCQACHGLDENIDTKINYQYDSPHDFVDGFQPLTKAHCSQCHTPQAAGDSCLQCHRYHVGD